MEILIAGLKPLQAPKGDGDEARTTSGSSTSLAAGPTWKRERAGATRATKHIAAEAFGGVMGAKVSWRPR